MSTDAANQDRRRPDRSGPALRLVRRGVPFPFVPYPPLHCRPVGDKLCVAAIDGLVRDTRLVLLDRDGRPASPVLVLPFLITGLDVADGELVMTANRDGGRILVGLDPAEDAVSWTADLPQPDELTSPGEPVVTSSGIEVTWETGFDRSTLWTARADASGCGEPRQLGFGDLTLTSALGVVADRVALARVHGERQQLDLVWLADGEVTGTVPLAERAGVREPSLGALAGAAVVAWDDRAGLRLTRVEVDAAPRRPRAELRVSLVPADLRSCDMITGPQGGQAALLWHVERLGDPEPVAEAPGRYEPARLVEGRVAALDGQAWQLGKPIQLDPPGTFHHAGGWLDDRLVLVHGGQQPVVTVLEAV